MKSIKVIIAIIFVVALVIIVLDKDGAEEVDSEDLIEKSLILLTLINLKHL